MRHSVIAPGTATMQTLFIGQTYIDVTFLTDRMPTGDEKHVASAYAISFGGYAVTAAILSTLSALRRLPSPIRLADLCAGLLHVGNITFGSLYLSFRRNHPMPPRCRSVGAVHSIKSGSDGKSVSCPLLPQ